MEVVAPSVVVIIVPVVGEGVEVLVVLDCVVAEVPFGIVVVLEVNGRVVVDDDDVFVVVRIVVVVVVVGTSAK